MKDTELKSCPFCGHKATHWWIGTNPSKHIIKCNKHIVQCNWCGIRTKEYAKEEGAFNAWNRRCEK